MNARLNACAQCCQWVMSRRKKKKKTFFFYHPCQWDSCSLRCSPLVGTSCRFIKRGELLVLMKSRAAAKKWVKEGWLSRHQPVFRPCLSLIMTKFMWGCRPPDSTVASIHHIFLYSVLPGWGRRYGFYHSRIITSGGVKPAAWGLLLWGADVD